jgi:hypothetical protein
MLSGYLRYCNLAETDFITPYLKFENPDQEDLLTDYQSELKVLGPGGFFSVLIQGTCPFHLFSFFPLQTDSPVQKTFVLRC